MGDINVVSPISKNIKKIPENDEDTTNKKEKNINKRSHSSNQKNKKGNDENINNDNSNEETEEVVHFPTLIDIKHYKSPQYIAYTDATIDGDVILKDLKGELWLQPSSSILSKKSENRLRLNLENSSKLSKTARKGSRSKNKFRPGDDLTRNNSYDDMSDNDNDSSSGFDNNFKRNFDKYFTDLQKLIDYAKNPVFNEDSTQNISINLDSERHRKRAQSSNIDSGSSDSQKISFNGRKPMRIINLELEMKLDNLRNNDIERENFERKIEHILQTRKIQKINFNILVNNRKIKKMEEIKQLKNEYIERYNKHIIEVLKQERKILYQKLDNIKKKIEYKNLCSEIEKEREKKMVERVNVSKYDLVLKRWLTLCIIGSRMMLIQDALVANLKEFVF